ncbi:MAG: hypothetical protein NVSMB57_16340 [Actinomycetota bacterium]
MPEEHAQLTANDPEGFGRAAREGMRTLVVAEIERAGLTGSDELQPCPKCGEHIIHPSIPHSYMKDRARGVLVCAPCGTERSVLHMILPDVQDTGGESG